MDWQFNPDNYDPNGYGIIPEGKYRVRIEEAEETTSRNSGKPMIKLTLSVSGSNSKLWNYTVLDGSNDEARKRTDNYLGKIFDSFGINPGDMNLSHWLGKAGGAKIRHRKDDNGDTRAEIHYFLKRSEVQELPAWRDGNLQPVTQSFEHAANADFQPLDPDNEKHDFSFDAELKPEDVPF